MCIATTHHEGRATAIGRPAIRVIGGRLFAALLCVLLLGATPVPREFDLGIVKRRIEASPSTIRVGRGDTVVLRWRTDEAVRLHLHGYDLRASVSPAAPASMRFTAGVAGRFAITAHGFGTAAAHADAPKTQREITLLYLEVLPE